MWNAGLDDSQTGIKIDGRNINNLRYADHTTLMAESEEELKNLLMKVEEESEKTGLKLNIQKTKIMASGPFVANRWGNNRNSAMLCLAAQSCLTLCNLMDCSPPGSSVHGDSPGKNTGVGFHALLQGNNASHHQLRDLPESTFWRSHTCTDAQTHEKAAHPEQQLYWAQTTHPGRKASYY